MEGRGWLGFGPRARAPQVAVPPVPGLMATQSDVGAVTAPTAELSLQRSLSQILTQQPAQKTARLSRISSYMGLSNATKAHATTAVTTAFHEQTVARSDSMSSRKMSYHEAPHDPSTGIWRTSSNADNDFTYKESDQTWHNPNLMQMMDTVSSTIMSNGISQPIPRHLNSFVIGMIEEVRIRLSNQSTLEAKFEELRSTQKKEVQEFAAMADEWKQREAGFKSEVRRLEQIIAQKAGVSSVVIARAGSAYNRNDAKDFQAKLNRLSKTEDEDPEFHNVQQVVMEGEMRNFAVIPMTKDSNREIVLDHNSDAFMSKLWREKKANLADRRNEDLLKRKSAAQQFFDDNGRPRLSRDGSSKKACPQTSNSSNSSSGAASSASSSLIVQGLLAERAAQDHVTPHTTPPRPEPVKPSPGANAAQAPTAQAPTAQSPAAQAPKKLNALQTIQELMRVNGGLPEDAIDDEDSSYGPSFVPPSQVHRYSFDAHHNQSPVHDTTLADVTSQEPCVIQNEPPRLDSLTPQSKAPGPVDEIVHDDNEVPVSSKKQNSNESPGSQSSQSSQSSCRSSTLMAMAHNCIDHAGQVGGPDCPRNSPMRKMQSGADPFPDEATKYKYRSERTVLNAHIREVAYLTNKELSAVMDDRSCRQSAAPVVPAKIVHNPNAPRVKAPKPVVRCPPGFEAHAAAGLLPFQQAAAKKAEARKAAAKEAANVKNEVMRGKAGAVVIHSTGSTWEEENDDCEA